MIKPVNYSATFDGELPKIISQSNYTEDIWIYSWLFKPPIFDADEYTVAIWKIKPKTIQP